MIGMIVVVLALAWAATVIAGYLVAGAPGQVGRRPGGRQRSLGRAGAGSDGCPTARRIAERQRATARCAAGRRHHRLRGHGARPWCTVPITLPRAARPGQRHRSRRTHRLTGCAGDWARCDPSARPGAAELASSRERSVPVSRGASTSAAVDLSRAATAAARRQDAGRAAEVAVARRRPGPSAARSQSLGDRVRALGEARATGLLVVDEHRDLLRSGWRMSEAAPMSQRSQGAKTGKQTEAHVLGGVDTGVQTGLRHLRRRPGR